MKLLIKQEIPLKDKIVRKAVSPDNQLLAVLTAEQQLQVYDLRASKLLSDAKIETGKIIDLFFLTSQKLLLLKEGHL